MEKGNSQEVGSARPNGYSIDFLREQVGAHERVSAISIMIDSNSATTLYYSKEKLFTRVLEEATFFPLMEMPTFGTIKAEMAVKFSLVKKFFPDLEKFQIPTRLGFNKVVL